jgi:hypothetical protein
MDNQKYSITLEDGTKISDLTLNGVNYVSDVEIKAELFENNLGTVVISDGQNEEVHTNMELLQIAKYGREYYFVIRDIPQETLILNQIRADLDYTMMMNDID